MMEHTKYPEHLVFGLDIGTRSIVGSVGFMDRNQFKIIAHYVKEHDTRAMMDGQIHDIQKVGETIDHVKKELEMQLERPLKEVCIAAAGRVLKTVTVHIDYEFPEETVVNGEHIYSLDLLGVEKAYEIIREQETETKFYCVGYTVIKYYLNQFVIQNLEGHKARRISADVLATFLPDEVVDGLYAAVGYADLQVANLTLEPIAAIQVAIPEQYRLLNIALVDVGAGTSDISITKDGSIIAYGMIPSAGDELTEILMKHYLVDFATAEKLKLSSTKKKPVSYKDIMNLSHKADPSDIKNAVKDTVDKVTYEIAQKIQELNGNKSVSAVFIVGGGGKVAGFTEKLAEYLNLSPDRVALRGEEVLNHVEFLQKGIKKDPLLVTPIGICLNFYNQKNNFIFVHVNDERIKLYDNDRLTVMDAAMQIGYPNDCLFPRRGKELNFMVNGKQRMVRGDAGEPAIIRINGEEAHLNSHISKNDRIQIIDSTFGQPAVIRIEQLPEYKSTISFVVNDQRIICPKFAEVNGQLESGYYEITEMDSIVILDYYSVEQLMKFLDLDMEDKSIYVNNTLALPQDKVYENFSVRWVEDKTENSLYDSLESEPVPEKKAADTESVSVTVNGTIVTMNRKENYILVDIFDYYPFDLTVAKGTDLTVRLNGSDAKFTDMLQNGDVIDLFWVN